MPLGNRKPKTEDNRQALYHPDGRTCIPFLLRPGLQVYTGCKRSGICPCAGVNLYYQLRGPDDATERVVMVMGAFGSFHWLEALSDRLAQIRSVQVLLFDNRGIGASAEASPLHRTEAASPSSYTVELLAQDLWRLVDHVWGSEAAVHLYGVSMGGMIAQVAAAQEMRRRSATGQPSRVRSLFLSVTSRGIHPVGSLAHGMRWVLPLGHRLGLVRRLVPFILQPSLSTVLQGLHRPRMVEQLLVKGFSDEYMMLPHPAEGRTMRELWVETLSEKLEQWNCFHDPDACVQHLNLLMTHHLSDGEAQLLSESGVSITVHVAAKDRIVPTRSQWELVRCLKASRVIVTDGGHMGDNLDAGAFWVQVEEHFSRTSAQE